MLNALDFKRWLPTIHGSNVLARFTSRVHKIVDVFAFQQIFSQTFLKLDVRTVCKCVFYKGILFLLKRFMPIILNLLFMSDKVMMQDAVIILKKLEECFVFVNTFLAISNVQTLVFLFLLIFCSIFDKEKHVLYV